MIVNRVLSVTKIELDKRASSSGVVTITDNAKTIFTQIVAGKVGKVSLGVFKPEDVRPSQLMPKPSKQVISGIIQETIW